jgi:hypothetical protein
MLNMKAMCLYKIGRKKEACQTWREASKKGASEAQLSLNQYCR